MADAPKVEIYLTRSCPYCHMARGLLDQKGVSYEVVDVGADPSRRAEMTQRSNGGRTVPQIFIDGRPVGGSDDIHALDRMGKLDPMLGL
ncbi:glutaredoxin 3 [Paracoccus sp. S-4012]|uniref:glutaredoxin 3 n=1 Tax=Paracoccus sp. S-4012 TaxID=2665648 RepID=UPI0012AEFC30|nr:glutaredoxin 3 [Paracoccus sp. S-4012]